mmetsp:Transcript_28194/g.77051  ORF Transcript_28194/g.77051 Transcript_28194/m.77051 type:complete len:136 (+) Transcript_28194:1782-2189(+)|eukprot:scaffold192019_cov27-Tisochrysis_lutea.AAC.2
MQDCGTTSCCSTKAMLALRADTMTAVYRRHGDRRPDGTGQGIVKAGTGHGPNACYERRKTGRMVGGEINSSFRISPQRAYGGFFGGDADGYSLLEAARAQFGSQRLPPTSEALVAPPPLHSVHRFECDVHLEAST